MSAPEIYSPGLEGVIAGETAVSTIEGGLRYRGYPVTELAEKCCFDEVAYLLLHGDLPNASSSPTFRTRVAAARRLPAPLQGTVPGRAEVDAADGRRCARPSASSPTSTRTWTTTRPRPTCARRSGCSPRFPLAIAEQYRVHKGLQPIKRGAGPRTRRQLPLHAPRQGADPGRGAGLRRVADPVRRARVQRLDIHRPRSRSRRCPICTRASSRPSER